MAKDSLVVMGILAAMIVASVVFVYLPQAKKLDLIETQIASLDASIETDARKAKLVPELLRQIKGLKDRYNTHWEKRLPKRQELGAFLREISQNLEKEDLEGQLIKPGNPKKEELFHKLPISMQFRGTTAAVSGFLKRLDEMERLTRVEELNITADNTVSPTMLEVQMQVNIYFTDTDRLAG